MTKSSRHNIADFANGIFRPHGEIEIWQEGSVVRIEAAGPFNPESVAAMGRTAKTLFDESPAVGRHAYLSRVRNSVMASPEALEALGKVLGALDLIGRTPVAVAWVVSPEVEGVSIMMRQYARVYAAANRNFRYFSTEAEAEAWLRQQLAAAD